MKKILTLILALCLVLGLSASLLCLPATAEDLPSGEATGEVTEISTEPSTDSADSDTVADDAGSMVGQGNVVMIVALVTVFLVCASAGVIIATRNKKNGAASR